MMDTQQLKFMRAIIFFAMCALTLSGQAPDPGRQSFEGRCAKCHGGDGNGGELGPAIVSRLSARTDVQLTALIRDGMPGTAMPGQPIPDAEMAPLVRFLRSIQPQPGRGNRTVVRAKVTLTDGKILEGQLVGQGFTDMQLRTDDKKVHLLRRVGEKFREVTSEKDWPTYNGDVGGNRYTTLNQITRTNVTRLGPKWVFTLPNAARLQVTPLVVGGIMYVTNTNECYALDAGTGRQIWRFQYARQRGAVGNQGGVNRGVAATADKVFLATDNAHIIALNRFTGETVWDTEMADWKQNYSATSAPLVAGNLVISGTTGGEHGANGFVAAFDVNTGKEAWRFWVVPKPGDPGSETWQGKDIAHGGGPAWFTGTYDPQLDMLYWPTGNPGAEYNGDNRKGDNLYTDCILALDAKTGKLKWHYQTTPHDLWDWDATETPMVIDANWQGQPRKLLVQANRNGYFYVWDRTDGKLLLWKPFVNNLTWATGIDAKGKPIKVAGQEPSAAGTRVCPSQDGATNWYSPSYNPATGLYYVQSMEKCSVYTKSPQGEWESGKAYLGGSQRIPQGQNAEASLKAINLQTGSIEWQVPEPGPVQGWGGTLTTSTGLVIVGEEGGSLMAVDAANGKALWNFPTNQVWKASPMTYMFDGKQYIAVAAGPNIISFGILE
jgi:alcohol dehydrogenase (cytochrome c)